MWIVIKTGKGELIYSMKIKKVTVAGSGVLGSQIAFQIAFKEIPVSIYDINDEAIIRAKERITHLKDVYTEEIMQSEKEIEAVTKGVSLHTNLLPDLTEAFEKYTDDAWSKINQAIERISYYSSLSEAVEESDLVIEAIPEVVSIKQNFYKNLNQIAPQRTIFATNSSTLLPSLFSQDTGRPEKFLAFHFANEIWKHNTVEIMGHDGTSLEIIEEMYQFAKEIGMIPIRLNKEQPGYILNSILVPFLQSAQVLVMKGVSDSETIDKTWMLATGAPQGPFGILDIVGIQTAYNIIKNYADTSNNELYKKLSIMLKEEYLDKGKLGQESGEGFYKYPKPKYRQPGFLS